MIGLAWFSSVNEPIIYPWYSEAIYAIYFVLALLYGPYSIVATGQPGKRLETERCRVRAFLRQRPVLPYAPLHSLRALSPRGLPSIYRIMAGASQVVAGQGPLARDGQVALVEAALLAAEEPLTTRKLAEVASLKDSGEARRLLRKLQHLYHRESSALHVVELAGGFQLLTRPEYFDWLANWRALSPEGRLSSAARETLTIIAYRQPVMRADIEAIRGVQCGDVLRLLMDRNLIRIAGRHPSLGRPVLYGTTRRFLQVFGLKSLEDLPLADQINNRTAASQGSDAGAEGTTGADG